MGFSFEALKNVQICLISLLKPNRGVKKMRAACQIPRPPGTEVSPRSHPGVSVQLLTDSSLVKIQDSEGPGSERPSLQPFLLQTTELRVGKG